MVTINIDIVIPVYNAYDDLQNCVDSVLRTIELPHHVTLIDDCSPDERIREYFAYLAELNDPRLNLLSNHQNLGFVRTVNRGMASSQNDVVLLNSDTIVTSEWLEKLIHCAESADNIGTITPFSNNAEICSFPNFCEDNKLSDSTDIEKINKAIEAAAVPLYPDIPTAVGFCMYIKRSLLDSIGSFDAETFRLGYGEENDFCRRAVNAGWRNVLCDDTFIAHVGSSSFTTTKQELAAENLQKLLGKHPDYQQVVSTFIQADPIKPIRQLAQSYLALRGERKNAPGILHIMHGSGGGTEQHIRNLMQGSSLGKPTIETLPPIAPIDYRHYLLTAVNDNWTLFDSNPTEEITYNFQRQPDQLWSDFLKQICATFKINFCHIHHVANCRPGLLAACSGLDIPYGISVHDHYLACPTINMLDSTGFYCSAETNLDKCQNCLAKQEDFADVDIKNWREENMILVENAKMIIGPSYWAVDTLKKFFKTPTSYVVPHGVNVPVNPVELPPVLSLPDDDRINIGILGAIGPVKGARQLEGLVEQTRSQKLPIRWIVIGYTDTINEPFQSEDSVICVHGGYSPEQVQGLLEHYQVKLVVFPSTGPETYCYTLTEAWSAGIPALVPPIGALKERVRETDAGWMMSDWQNVDAILEDVLEILSEGKREGYLAKSELAMNVIPSSIHDMVDTTAGIYQNIVSINDEVQTEAVDKVILHRALQSNDEIVQALQLEPATTDFIVPTSSWGRLNLYLRNTLLGRLGALILPIRLKEILKRWMIGEVR
jgi:O-antigen biosynthesis protein